MATRTGKTKERLFEGWVGVRGDVLPAGGISTRTALCTAFVTAAGNFSVRCGSSPLGRATVRSSTTIFNSVPSSRQNRSVSSAYDLLHTGHCFTHRYL